MKIAIRNSTVFYLAVLSLTATSTFAQEKRVLPEQGQKIGGMAPLIGAARGVITGTKKAGDGTLKGNEKPFIEKSREHEKAEKKGRTG